MPIHQVQKKVSAAASKIRRHWTRDEARRRQALAEAMQEHLRRALGLIAAPVVETRA